LISISQKNRTAEEIAEDLRIPISEINHHLERLERFYIIRNVNINRYIYADKVLEFWVCGAKSRYKRVAGPYLVGTEVERQLALFLLEHGIDLIYQSFQSRGAFDLLMEFDHTSIAIQVKKVNRFYYHFSRASYNRMVDYVERFGRRWGVVCLYNGEEFRFYKLQVLNQTKQGYSITKKTSYTKNPLALL
jgi:Holliday junction resolvase